MGVCVNCKIKVDTSVKDAPAACYKGVSGMLGPKKFFRCCNCHLKHGGSVKDCDWCHQRKHGAPPAQATPTPAPVRAVASAPQHLNAPGKWQAFLSHVQSDAGKEAQRLYYELGGASAVWLDVMMSDKGVDAMMEGAMGSANFILLLTPTYFEREFCRKELEMAQLHGKNIVLCHTPATKPSLSALFAQANGMGFKGIGDAESVELILNDPDYAAVTIKKLKAKMVA